MAAERGWRLESVAAHPGFTRTNLQTAGASLGQDRQRHAAGTRLPFAPSQEVEQGAEPLLFAATDPAAATGGYYGPRGRFELVGPTAPARVPARGRDAALAARLWAESERLTGVSLPVATR